MRRKYTISLAVSLVLLLQVKAQIAPNYSVGTWSQFNTAAVSYTFDDDCSNQISICLPMFDKYNYKMTFFTVTGGGYNPNWAKLKTASANGHEVGSHTVTHSNLNIGNTTSGAATENTELQQSQSTINSNITNAKCVSLAYPNCNEGDVSIMQKYYIAGRICNGQLVSKTPSDFFQIGAIITGDQGSVQKTADFDGKVASAKSSGSWCVFLTHAIDKESGFSPTVSAAIESHLINMTANNKDVWVATFGNVVKYIKERNAASLTETTITSDSLKLTCTNTLDNTIYNVPITIRRVLPNGWKNPKVYIGGKIATSTLIKSNNVSYIQFDVIPNQGNIFLSNSNSIVTDLEEEIMSTSSIAIEPNPFWQETVLKANGDFTYFINSTDGRKIESGAGTNLLHVGNSLPLGVYIVSIHEGSTIRTFKIIKN